MTSSLMRMVHTPSGRATSLRALLSKVVLLLHRSLCSLLSALRNRCFCFFGQSGYVRTRSNLLHSTEKLMATAQGNVDGATTRNNIAKYQVLAEVCSLSQQPVSDHFWWKNESKQCYRRWVLLSITMLCLELKSSMWPMVFSLWSLSWFVFPLAATDCSPYTDRLCPAAVDWKRQRRTSDGRRNGQAAGSPEASRRTELHLLPTH